MITETERVAAALRDAIIRGEFPPGQRIPHGRYLAERYATTEAVVKAARRVLANEGLLTIVRRGGTTVRTSPLPTVIRDRGVLHDDHFGYYFDQAAFHWIPTRPAAISFATPPPDVAAILATDDALCRDRALGPEGGPAVQLAASWIPRDVAEACSVTGPVTGPQGIYARFEEGGHEPLSWAEQVTSRMPSPGERNELSVPPGTPLLRVLRLTHSKTPLGRVIEVCDVRIRADRYAVSYRLRRRS